MGDRAVLSTESVALIFSLLTSRRAWVACWVIDLAPSSSNSSSTRNGEASIVGNGFLSEVVDSLSDRTLVPRADKDEEVEYSMLRRFDALDNDMLVFSELIEATRSLMLG